MMTDPSQTGRDHISLRYEIDPELYRRAVTQPIPARSNRWVVQRNVAAAVLFSLASFLFLQSADWQPYAISALGGFAVGAASVFLLWKRQHAALTKIHGDYNETAGGIRFSAGPDGLQLARPYVSSVIDWPAVHSIRQIDGATLVELPTARVIVPDAALPSDLSATDFCVQLNDWHKAQAK